MTQSYAAYETQRYTFRVVILTRLVRSRYDKYRWIIREASFHKAMGFRYRSRVTWLPIYAYRCNYGTVVRCVPDTEVHFSRRNSDQVGPIAIGPYRWIVCESSFHKAKGFRYRLRVTRTKLRVTLELWHSRTLRTRHRGTLFASSFAKVGSIAIGPLPLDST
jgi:hypothetical protein